VWKAAEGAYLYDVEGRRVLDFRCGYSAINFGHTPQRLIEAAEKQMRSLTQLTQLPSTALIEFAEQLLSFLGCRGTAKVLLNVSGARAIETALKIALHRRPGTIVCFEHGYHGRSLATQPLSDASTFSEAWPWPGLWSRSGNGDICRLPYPREDAAINSTLNPLTRNPRACDWSEVLELWDQCVASRDVPLSAVLIEPMLGARGYIAPPEHFFHELLQRTHERGGLVIADEVQVGLGRGGGRLMSHAQGWQPDLVVLGKSLGGGLLPISAVVGAAGLIDLLPNGSESETFAAHPLACAVASAALDWLQELEPGLPQLGTKLREIFQAIVRRWELPAEVQGVGVVAALEWRGAWPEPNVAGLHSDVKPQDPIAQTVARLSQQCLAAGLLLHPSGPDGRRMVFLPPLTVTEEQLEEAGSKFEAALASLAGK
jgi:4-aminobutyrate aminotransferase-like enzyme